MKALVVLIFLAATASAWKDTTLVSHGQIFTDMDSSLFVRFSVTPQMWYTFGFADTIQIGDSTFILPHGAEVRVHCREHK